MKNCLNDTNMECRHLYANMTSIVQHTVKKTESVDNESTNRYVKDSQPVDGIQSNIQCGSKTIYPDCKSSKNSRKSQE